MQTTRRNLFGSAAATGVVPVMPVTDGPADDTAEIAALCGQFERLGRHCADAELLASCGRFLAAHRDLTASNTGPSDAVTEGQGNEILARWYDEIDRLIELPAHTDEGRRAKAMAAYLTMATIDVGDFEGHREEHLGFSALADLVGRGMKQPQPPD